MTAYQRAHSAQAQRAPTIDWRKALLFLLAAVLIVATLCLAAIGLDAFNDLLARGFTSMSNPSG